MVVQPEATCEQEIVFPPSLLGMRCTHCVPLPSGRPSSRSTSSPDGCGQTGRKIRYNESNATSKPGRIGVNPTGGGMFRRNSVGVFRECLTVLGTGFRMLEATSAI